MDFLQDWQIKFEEVALKPYHDKMLFGFISKRLYRLIVKKTKIRKWKVLYFVLDFGWSGEKFKPALIAPRNGAILFIKRRI